MITSVVVVHDASIVKHDIHSAPGFDVFHKGGDLSLLTDITGLDFDFADSLRDDLLHFGETLFQGWAGYVGQEYICTLPRKED